MDSGRKKRGRNPNYSGSNRRGGSSNYNHHNNPQQYTKRQRRDDRNNRGTGTRHWIKSDPEAWNGSSKVKSEARFYHDRATVKREPKAEPKSEEALLPMPEIDFPSKEENDEKCVFIPNLPDDASKEKLARFIRHQYKALRQWDVDIVGVTIRKAQFYHDAIVEFGKLHHALEANNVLRNANFGGTTLKVKNGKADEKTWYYYMMDAISRQEKEKKMNEEKEKEAKGKEIVSEADDGDMMETNGSRSDQLEFFLNPPNVEQCLYISNLPDKIGTKELRKFILKKCTIEKGTNRPPLDPEITACFVRSQTKDACVEFKSHTRAIMLALENRSIKGKDIKVKEWKSGLSKTFAKYYREKEERKRQKKAQKDQPEQQNQLDLTVTNTVGAESTDALLSDTNDNDNNNNSANSSALEEALKGMRSNFVKVTSDHNNLKSKYRTLSEEKEMLTQKLNQEREKAARREEESNELREELHQARKEADEAKSRLQKEVTAMKQKQKEQSGTIKELNEKLYLTKQDLTNARQEKDSAQEALQALREKYRKEEGQGKVKMKVELLRSELKNGVLKQKNRALEKQKRLGVVKTETVKKEVGSQAL